MSLNSALWLLSLVLNGSLFAALLGKGYLRRLPFFAGYAAYTLFSGGLIYLLKEKISDFAYFCTYWGNEAVGVMLGFAVVYEIFGKLLTPYPALRRLEKDSLVRGDWEDSRIAVRQERPPRRYYKLTRQGKDVLASAVERYPLLARLAPEEKATRR